jgi:hypothetical protein
MSWSSSLHSLLHPTATIVHLGPKYLPQYTILKHPMHMPLLQCARRTFIPSPHRRNYMFVHFRASHFPTAKISAPAVLILKRWSSSHRMRQQYWQLYDMAIWKHLHHLKYWCVPTQKKKQCVKDDGIIWHKNSITYGEKITSQNVTHCNSFTLNFTSRIKIHTLILLGAFFFVAYISNQHKINKNLEILTLHCF